MKRILIVTVTVAFCLSVMAPAQAKPNHRGPCQSMSMRETIICAEHLWPSSADSLLYIAERESGFAPGAVSPSGTYLGVFQIGRYHMPAWPNEVMPQPWFHQWFPHVSYADSGALLNGRFNVFLAVRIANAYGLGPWGQ